MKKVITYGTFDLLHHGHIRLLERAKALGDYLIVGITSDDFDKQRGKINVAQPLMERLEAVRATHLADEIIVEEYEGQKIDDIKKYGVDIFTVGSDWEGHFDYLNEYCQVVYLPRTEGVSSTQIREKRAAIRLGLVGNASFLNKVITETGFVNGLDIAAVCTSAPSVITSPLGDDVIVTDRFEELLEKVDAVYIRSLPADHAAQIRQALEAGRHVLCESPLTLDPAQADELFALAADKGLTLMEAIKTAYSTAFMRLLLLVKGGAIGDVVSIDSTCTSLRADSNLITDWNGIYEWGPTALLPVLSLLGSGWRDLRMYVRYSNEQTRTDSFTKMDFLYDKAVASIKVGDGVKSEGDLVISGTSGYIYVPAPWWKTDYFELRYEDVSRNKRHFYQLDGEGIRYELVAFVRSIEGNGHGAIDEKVTGGIAQIMKRFVSGDGVERI